MYWRRDEEDQLLTCSYCGMQETLWVCLTCAFVGCGRYSNKHAAQHYQETGHPFCLELSTLRIWSYILSEFAHRADLLECPNAPPLLHPWIVRPQMLMTASASAPGGLLPDHDLVAASVQEGLAEQERFVAAESFGSVDEKNPKKATMIGEEYEALLQSALEEQAQHYEGEISWLRATLTAEQVDQGSMTPAEAAEVKRLRADIAKLRADIDRAGRELLDSQAQEADQRATSQRLLREQKVAQDLLEKIREESAREQEQGRMQMEELELQIADLTANQKMRHQFSQDEELLNAQIFGTTGNEAPPSQPRSSKKGKKARGRFLRNR
jgi:BRCA1-associated protein